MLTSILTTEELTIPTAILCTVISLVLGLIIALVYMYTSNSSKNFVITLVLLPALVQLVIMMVNGNLGTGVAVMGAFSLVRFRSVPGSAKEISSIFFAMAVGLATAMGYLIFAGIFTIIISIVFIALSVSNFGVRENNEKELKITIPENLDYTGIFDDIFREFTKKVSLDRVKTTNLGSMYELCYHIVLKDKTQEKKLIDEIRCRNGNLTVICGRQQIVKDEL